MPAVFVCSPCGLVYEGVKAQGVKAMDYTIEKLEGGAVFRLTRPAKLNAITKAILKGLSDCIDALER
jgi:hypothetical protein